MTGNDYTAALEAFLKGYPSIKHIASSSPEFSSLKTVWNRSRRAEPLAVIQPQSATDVAALIKFARSNHLPFTLRSGGHNLEGRAVSEGALLIDLRALTTVTVASDRKSATVGGGILQQELGNKLWAEGLATSLGTVPSVGYVGWATYGGYGPFSSHWGLGVDQILGATIVNADGEITKADDVVLEGIRGAGGLFGVILDLTVKVYPLTSLLAGPIIFDSSDITKAFIDFNAAYSQLLDTETVPPQLTLQQLVFNSPHGRLFAVNFVWSGADIEEGQRWIEKISKLGPLMMSAVAPTTVPEWYAANGAMIPTSVYGSSWTYNLTRISSAVAEAIGRNLASLPTDPVAMFSIHQLRGPSAGPQSHSSVFGTREPHYMLEILGYAAVEAAKEESEKWAARISAEVARADPASVLPTVYVSLFNSARAKSSSELLEKAYGSNAKLVRTLKENFDPDNVFNLTVPAVDYGKLGYS